MSARAPKPAAMGPAAGSAAASPPGGAASLGRLDGLIRRCAALEDPAEQGEPMNRLDYLLLALATILLPASIILIGGWL
ncbi:hypothetical protein ACWEQC_10070 [Streptomyces shenzhenensis]